MQADCPMCNSWSNEKYVLMARREPKRIEFWLPYSESYEDACRSVCDNSPSFDSLFRKEFPNPTEYRKMVRAQKKAELAATTANIAKPKLPDFDEVETYVLGEFANKDLSYYNMKNLLHAGYEFIARQLSA